MRIRTTDTVVTSPARNFVTLRLVTEDGVTGWGDATSTAADTYLTQHVAPLLIGRDANHLAVPAPGVRTGGVSRTGALAYGHASGRDLPELFDSIRAHLAEGIRANRVQTGSPAWAGSTTTPLAIGEVFNTINGYTTLLTSRLIDYVRSAVTHAGITAMKTSPRSTAPNPASTAPPTSPPSAWPPPSTSTWPSTTSVSRSTRPTPPRPTRCSAPPTPSPTACSIPPTPPESGWRWMSRLRRSSRTGRLTLPINRLTDGTVHDW
jgi:hypothetical protein